MIKIENNTKIINFRAGLTSKIHNEITSCDVKKIVVEFEKFNIPADFKQNKVIAWCALKSLHVAQKLGLGLPKGVFAEDFENLKSADNKFLGICNAAPTQLYKNKSDIICENTVFYNTNYDWEMVDEISDEMYANGDSSTDFFQEIFLHEFSHVMHNTNLINRLGGKRYVKTLISSMEESQKTEFSKKYAPILSQICHYAAQNPYDAVACDLSKRTIENLDKNTLNLEENYISKSPYRNTKKFDICYEKDELSKLLRKFWKGNF